MKCSTNENRNRMKKAGDSECLYSFSHQSPLFTGQGASFPGFGTRSTGSFSLSFFDPAEPFRRNMTVNITYMPIWRNSFSPFSKVASIKVGTTKVGAETEQRHALFFQLFAKLQPTGVGLRHPAYQQNAEETSVAFSYHL